MLRRLIVPLTLLALAGCAGGSAATRRYAEAPPEQLVRDLDARTYSPADAGLRRVEADLLVDITGFFPEAKRPAAPVRVPVHFSWNAGRGTFSAGAWPKEAAALEAKVLESLRGKEDDLVARSYRDRLAGFRLAVTADGDALVLAAQAPGKADKRTYLYVNEDLLVDRMTVIDEGRRVDSKLVYDGKPAVLTVAESAFEAPQATRTTVTIAYGRAGKYTLPSKLTYQTTIGAKTFPALTIEVKNVKTSNE